MTQVCPTEGDPAGAGWPVRRPGVTLRRRARAVPAAGREWGEGLRDIPRQCIAGMAHEDKDHEL